MDRISPRDRFITVYGRKPVLEAIRDTTLTVDKVVLADNAHGPEVREIEAEARRRGVGVQVASAQRVKVLAGNGRHDQGVLADVVAPRMLTVAAAIEARRGAGTSTFVLLDGLTTPANVGMIIRTATAAGVDGVVIPRKGVASIDPLVIKASAGVAFHAPIVKAFTALEAAQDLASAGYRLLGLDGSSPTSVYDAALTGRTVLVLGGETSGIDPLLRALLDDRVSIPMAHGVESLNVSAAAAVVCFEMVRQRLA